MTVEKYGIFELKIVGAADPVATFTCGADSIKVSGFQSGEGMYAVRFMPKKEGEWKYSVKCGDSEKTGSFECVKNSGINHGPVEADGTAFRYADGSVFAPVGTTCYAWIHQPVELIEETYKSFENAPFNKVRMCLFPKHMPYNHNDPDLYPFEKDENGGWDVNRPCFKFWDHFDSCMMKLMDMGIEADLILFHPYDRWGFSKFSREEDFIYLDYCIRRLSAYRNIWWSLANEYDFVGTKTKDDWEAFGEKVNADDPYGHLLSIHNGMLIYPKTDWMTHVSIQHKVVANVSKWIREFNLPVIIDECGYEGNIEFGWGNLSAFEMVHRAWISVVKGGYITHGETYYREDEVLWWAKGGKLYGESPARFAFLKNLQYEIGVLQPTTFRALSDPNNPPDESAMGEHAPFFRALLALPEDERANKIAELTPNMGKNENYSLQYLGRSCPLFMDSMLPENGTYRVEVIDVWDMTRKTVLDGVCGRIKIPLPAKEGIAVLSTRLSGDNF